MAAKIITQGMAAGSKKQGAGKKAATHDVKKTAWTCFYRV
jgi:hypothetical protein